MCGIVGYVGDQEATPILMGGLRRLEYRGYDSAGVAVANGGPAEVSVRRARVIAIATAGDRSVTAHSVTVE